MHDRYAQTLKPFAKKYMWWQSPATAVAMPQRVIAQVMNMGDYDDVQALAMALGDDALRDALQHAEAGQFNARSWHYWHYRLNLAEPGRVPPRPQRRFTTTHVDD